MKVILPHKLFLAIIAILLIFLYQKSLFDRSRYDKTGLKLLNISHLNALLDKQTLELQTGYSQNYDKINQTAVKIEGQLEQISADSNLKLSNTTRLQQLISNKLELIEQFKQKNALLHNALHYLSKLAEQYQSTFQNHATHKTQQALENTILTSYLLNSGIKMNARALIEKNRQLEQKIKTSPQLSPENRKLALKIIQFSQSTIQFGQDVFQLVNQIHTPELKTLVQNLQQQNLNLLKKQEETAEHYLIIMTFVSLLLLVYLAVLFFHLNKTRQQLSIALTELEFQKEAIDHHAIVSITDAKGNIIYVNKRFIEVSGYSEEEALGKNHRFTKSGVHDQEYYKNIWQTISSGKIWQGELINKNKHGDYYWVETTIMPRLDATGTPYQYIAIRTDITSQKKAEQKAAMLARFPEENPAPVMRINRKAELIYANPASQTVLDYWQIKLKETLPDFWKEEALHTLLEQKVKTLPLEIEQQHFWVYLTPTKGDDYINLYFHDITQTKKMEEQLSYQATHDNLTGLANRLAFEKSLEKILQSCQQNTKQQSVLLYLDLDQFKIVNDTCGHVAGDELLRQLAHILSQKMRSTDLLARLGGDEFGIILNNCPVERARQIAWSFCQTIKDYRFAWENKSFAVGASIGLVDICGQITSVSDALGAADIACYMAKDAGRNQVQQYSPTASDVLERHQEMMWATTIPKALEDEKFILYAQKIMALDKNNIDHYEILIRLRGKQDEIIPPGAFIPAAERFSLINSLDLWVIESCFQRLASSKNVTHISINLSGSSLGNESFLYQVIYLIQNNPINPEHITFEITETAAISNLSLAIEFIKEVKTLGCKFALDDFGSGLSSFAYLKNLPVDYLKIDGAFVKDILDDPIDEAMVQSINQIGHIMNIKTIAEFVESDAIKQRLQAIGVDYVQGYAIEHPVPLDRIINPD